MAQVIAFLKIIQDGIFPYKHTEGISTTNFLFRLHTKYISTTIIVTGVLIFIQQLFVDHLKCFRPGTEGWSLDVTVLNQFCYATTGTYSNHSDTSQMSQNQYSYQFQHYFQWVPYILLVQGILLYAPQLMWRNFVEDGRMERFCVAKVKTVGEVRSQSEPQLTGVGAVAGSGDATDNGQSPTAGSGSGGSVEPPKKASKVLSISFAKTLKSPENRLYFWGFLACEFINFVVVVVCFFTTDWLIHGHFAGLGANWVYYLQKIRQITKVSMGEMQLEENIRSLRNPLEEAFPTMYTCRWDKGNSILRDADAGGGAVTVTPLPEYKYKVSCVMSLNIIHQRIYLVFWFGFILLFCASIVNLIYTILLFLSKKLRRHLVVKGARQKGIPNTPELKEILVQMSVQDWFIFKRILHNVDTQRFDTIVEEIRESLFNSSIKKRAESLPEPEGGQGKEYKVDSGKDKAGLPQELEPLTA